MLCKSKSASVLSGVLFFSLSGFSVAEDLVIDSVHLFQGTCQVVFTGEVTEQFDCASVFALLTTNDGRTIFSFETDKKYSFISTPGQVDDQEMEINTMNIDDSDIPAFGTCLASPNLAQPETVICTVQWDGLHAAFETHSLTEL